MKIFIDASNLIPESGGYLHLKNLLLNIPQQKVEICVAGSSKLIKKSYDLLNLQTYFTAGEKEVRARTIDKGMTAPQAAGVIHKKKKKGFIRAEVISFNDYSKYKNETKVDDT